MSSTYSDQLRIELQGAGDNDGSWGGKLNTAFEMVEAAISGRAAVTHDDTANYTLTTANGTDDEARHMILNIGGALGAARNTVAPTKSKIYIAKNATTGGFATTLKTSGGTGISIPNGKTTLLFCDGTNVVDAIDYLSGLTLGGALIGATSQDVFNTVSTTVNAFGAASTALSIGHASAAATFAGGISIPAGKTLSGAGAISLTSAANANRLNIAVSDASYTAEIFTLNADRAGVHGFNFLNFSANSVSQFAVTGSGAVKIAEAVDGTPAGTANMGTLYCIDNGAGKTKLMVIFGSGTGIQLAIEA